MITILTAPSPLISYKINRKFRDFVRKYIKGKELVKYHGHPAVTRSLIEGLSKIGEGFVFNPKTLNEITDHVHVLGGVNTLKYAIKLKQLNKIKKLTAGPNVVISSADFNGLIASPEIDIFLVNSHWIKTAYIRDNPKLLNRIQIFPSGVDVDFWESKKSKTNSKKVAFYNKRPDMKLYSDCLKVCKENNFQVIKIKYGAYNLNQFKIILKEVDAVVYFVEQESQGIALLEIWGSDTPTIVWNPGTWNYKGVDYECSSAPYLTDYTGSFFKNIDEFKKLVIDKKFSREQYSPFKWIKNNLSDEKSAKIFVKSVTEN